MSEFLRKIIRKSKASFPDFLKGALVFLLAFSGFGFAILFRALNLNGTYIVTFSLLIEIASLTLCYFFLTNYLTSKESEVEEIPKKKKPQS